VGLNWERKGGQKGDWGGRWKAGDIVSEGVDSAKEGSPSRKGGPGVGMLHRKKSVKEGSIKFDEGRASLAARHEGEGGT